MKAEGVKRGVPDTFLAVARGGYHGLFIELKHGYNKATAEQAWWHGMLRDQDYEAVIVKEFEGARAAILEYLALDI